MSFKQARLKPGEAQAETAAACGPGPRLRDARLARSLTVEQAATMLKLEPTIVAALELDDYTQLPEPLYIKGYLTGYARLLGVPEREVEAAYRTLVGETRVPDLSRERSVPPQARSSDALVRSFSYLMIAGVCGLVGWWAYEYLSERSFDSVVVDSAATSTQTAGSTQVSPPPSQPDESSATSEPPRDTAPDEKPSIASTPSLQEPSVAAGTIPSSVEGVTRLSAAEITTEAMPEVAVLQSGPTTVTQPQRDVADTGASGTAAVADGTDGNTERFTVADTGSGFGTLQLRFQRDSWLEVRDLRGERLAYGLVKAGSTRNLRGQLPFRITLGDSGAVALVLDGNTVAPEAIGAADGQPLRFTLGETQDG